MTESTTMADHKLQLQSRLLHQGRPTGSSNRAVPVNPPVMRASTLLYPDVATMREVHQRRAAGERELSYGRRGTDTAFALEDVLTDMEGGHRTRLFSSGLSAIATTFLAFLRPGDHVLISDASYGPVRKNICVDLLDRLGVAYDFFAADGSDVESRIRPQTKMVYAESPGSVFYEMCDIRRLSEIAKPRDIPLVVDNTWASGFLHHPLALGADVSVIAATKYIVGHSDVMMGAAVCNASAWEKIDRMAHALGHVVSPDDAYLALRGLRTMPVRLAAHAAHADAVVQALLGQAGVRQVLFPALASHPGHAIWQRDFTGSCGLVTVELDTDLLAKAAQARGVAQRDVVDAIVDGLQLFGLGASWGGFESLVLPVDAAPMRSIANWRNRGPFLRFHIGLEDPVDLIADLQAAFGAALATPYVPTPEVTP